eukprot:820085-Pelagomonas_calceolata.AAC.1
MLEWHTWRSTRGIDRAARPWNSAACTRERQMEREDSCKSAGDTPLLVRAGLVVPILVLSTHVREDL